MSERFFRLAKKNSVIGWFLLWMAAIVLVLDKNRDADLFKVIKYYKGNPNSITLVRELLWTRYVAGCVYQQYYQYDFKNKTKTQRREYVGSYEFHDFLMKASTPQSRKKFENKYTAYQIFKDYYKRDVIMVSSTADYVEFSQFVATHKEFVAKPIDSHGGRGFRVINIEKTGAKASFLELIADGGAVCEELIEQSYEMARFHPRSINTVRLVTYYDGSTVTPMYAFLRLGVGGSRVDNTSAGGLAAAINVESGEIVSLATNRMDIDGEWFDRHPDTNEKITGAFLPRWKELLDMVQELAIIVPEQKYVGWDMALTDEGWVMVEGNAKPLISTIQILNHQGIREKYKHLLN